MTEQNGTALAARENTVAEQPAEHTSATQGTEAQSTGAPQTMQAQAAVAVNAPATQHSGAWSAPAQGTAAADTQAQLAALTELMTLLREDSARQCRYAKKQLFVTRVLTSILGAALAAVLCVCLIAAPRVGALLAGADDLVAQAQSMADELQTVSSQLSETDIAGMLTNVNTLVLQSQSAITTALTDVGEALSVIDSFDIEALNSSIRDLNSIIKPLALLLGRG